MSQTANRVWDQSLLSVVLPVYNEEGVLRTLYQSLVRVLDAVPIRYEIVFVNDGSRDAGPEQLNQLAAEDRRVRVLHLSRNFGHQAAVQAGLAQARGDAVVLMDSDLQDDPAALVRFLEEWRAGYDVVYAIRVARKENFLKRLLFLSFHRLLARLSATRIPTDAGNFGLMDRRVLDEVLRMGERDRYLPGLRSWVGFRQKGVEVERQARYDDQPRVSLWGLCRLAKTAIFSFSSFPLSVFYGIAGLALVAFLLLGGYSLGCRLFTDLAIPGWTSHILCGCLFGALNALGIGILGEYVIRIYDQVRQRPLYLVARAVNCDDESPRLPVSLTPPVRQIPAITDDQRLWQSIVDLQQLLAEPRSPTWSMAEASPDLLPETNCLPISTTSTSGLLDDMARPVDCV